MSKSLKLEEASVHSQVSNTRWGDVLFYFYKTWCRVLVSIQIFEYFCGWIFESTFFQRIPALDSTLCIAIAHATLSLMWAWPLRQLFVQRTFAVRLLLKCLLLLVFCWGISSRRLLVILQSGSSLILSYRLLTCCSTSMYQMYTVLTLQAQWCQIIRTLFRQRNGIKHKGRTQRENIYNRQLNCSKNIKTHIT